MSLKNRAMKNKICLITGATSGIGKATAFGLAELGATIVILSRDFARGETVKQEIRNLTQNFSIDMMKADLGDLKSIKSFSQQFREKYDNLHVLINNAGVYTRSRKETSDGYESMFGINHLGHFYLTNLLLDIIKSSSPSRIINVASRAQHPLNFDDLQSKENFSMRVTYGKSKFANIVFTYELAKRLEGSGITANCLHPGLIRTNLVRDFPNIVFLLMKTIRGLIKSPEKGAETSIYLASSSEVATISGKYFVDKKVQSSSSATYDSEAAYQLWKISETLIRKIIPEFSTQV